MTRTLLVLAGLALAIPQTARAQCRPGYCVDFRVLSAVLAYGTGRITNISVPDRVMHGMNARVDIHIVSLLLRKLPVRTYDALIGDVTYGRKTSDSLPGLFPGDVEGSTGFQATFGYQLLAGAQLNRIAVLGGLGWETRYHDIGGSTLDASSMPVIVRVEIGERRRIVMTGWTAVSGDPTVGGRIDVPFFRRLNLTAMYWQGDGEAEVWSDPGTKGPAKGRMLVLGFRTAEL